MKDQDKNNKPKITVKGDKAKLTVEIIRAGMSRNGGWSNKQFKCLGIDNPNKAPKGWKKHLERLCREGDVWLPTEDILYFLSLKNKHLK